MIDPAEIMPSMLSKFVYVHNKFFFESQGSNVDKQDGIENKEVDIANQGSEVDKQDGIENKEVDITNQGSNVDKQDGIENKKVGITNKKWKRGVLSPHEVQKRGSIENKKVGIANQGSKVDKQDGIENEKVVIANQGSIVDERLPNKKWKRGVLSPHEVQKRGPQQRNHTVATFKHDVIAAVDEAKKMHCPKSYEQVSKDMGVPLGNISRWTHP